MVLIVPRTPPKGDKKEKIFPSLLFLPKIRSPAGTFSPPAERQSRFPFPSVSDLPIFFSALTFPCEKPLRGSPEEAFSAVYLFPFFREPVSSFFRFCRIFFPLWPSALCSFFFVGLYIPGVTTFLVLFPCRTRRTSPFSS